MQSLTWTSSTLYMDLNWRLLGEEVVQYDASLGNGPPNANELAEILRNINDKTNKDALSGTGTEIITLLRTFSDNFRLVPISINVATRGAGTLTPYYWRNIDTGDDTVKWGLWTWRTPSTTPASTVPGMPRNLALTSPVNGGLTSNWDAPNNNGGEPITGYKLRYRRIS